MDTKSSRIVPLWTQQDLANLLGICTWTVWAMRKRGELPPAVRVGNQLRWRPEVIDAWIKERERSAEEFDPVLSHRAERAVEARLGRNSKSTQESGGEQVRRRGRPTKAETIAKRTRGQK